MLLLFYMLVISYTLAATAIAAGTEDSTSDDSTIDGATAVSVENSTSLNGTIDDADADTDNELTALEIISLATITIYVFRFLYV